MGLRQGELTMVMSCRFDVSTTTYLILESPSFHCNCIKELSCVGLITLYNLSMLETESKLCCDTVPFTAANKYIPAKCTKLALNEFKMNFN